MKYTKERAIKKSAAILKAFYKGDTHTVAQVVDAEFDNDSKALKYFFDGVLKDLQSISNALSED